MHQPAPAYSTLFTCLYDQQDPAVPRWTHHSIFRCVEYRDVTRKLLDKPIIHDFCVIWDSDHDERVIGAIERIYMEGLLSPIQFINEHKGLLTILIAAKAMFEMEETMEEYAKRVEEAANIGDVDYWPVALGTFSRHDRDLRTQHQTDLKHITGWDPVREHTFLLHLDGLWELGTKPWTHPHGGR